MTKNPDLRSVRVEIDTPIDATPTADVPIVSAGASGRKRGAIVAILGAAFVGLLLVLAQRESVDNVVELPTPTISPTADDGFDDGQFGTPLSGSTELFQPTTGASQLESVVRVPSGFVGLTRNVAADGTPIIVRSADGIDWTEVDTEFDDSLLDHSAELPPPAFEELVQTDDGFAMLRRTTEILAEDDTSRTISRILRLRSPDGFTWSVDPNFAPFESAGGSTRVVAHVAGSFVASTQRPIENPLLQDLLEGEAEDVLLPTAFCSVEPQTDGQLRFIACEGAEVFILTAASESDFARFELIGRCAVFLSQRWAVQSSFWVVQSVSGVAELAGANSLLFPPSVADDGRIVAIDFPSPPTTGELACQDFLEVEESPSPAVAVWDPQNSAQPVRHPIPEGIAVSSLLSVRAEPTISSAGLLVLLGSGLTSIDLMSIDLDSGAWEDVLTLPVRPDDETSVQISADGSRLIYLDSSRITVIQLDTRMTGYLDSAGGNRPGFPQIIYADNGVVFARGANSTFKIDVPAS